MFEELDCQSTELGELILRRRTVPPDHRRLVHEITLDGEFLMSSVTTESEEALARIPLQDATPPVDVLIGGLGLGHTAATALSFPSVRSVVVVESLGPVIGWHRRGLVPLGSTLTGDDRCRIEEADFFRYLEGRADPEFAAILVDIDHSPSDLLHPDHASFYSEEGMQRVASRLEPGGRFALWSADPFPDPFLARVRRRFRSADVHVVEFLNSHSLEPDANSILVAHR